MTLTRKEIIYRKEKIEELGMDCPSTAEAIIYKADVKALNEAFNIDRRIIEGCINDISLYL